MVDSLYGQHVAKAQVLFQRSAQAHVIKDMMIVQRYKHVLCTATACTCTL